MRRAPMICAALLLTAPHLASAQSWTLTLTPQVGWYRGTEPLGHGSPDGDLLRMAPSHVVGMLLGVGPENARWSVRLSFTTTLDADIQREELVVPDMCVECIISLREYGPTDHTGEMMMLGLQGTVSPTPRSWRVSPYLIAGAGLTRFDLGEGRYPAADGYEYGGREAAWAVHAGIGVSTSVGRGDLVIEAVNATSGIAASTALTPRSVAGQIFRDLRNDLTVSLGYRLRAF